MNMNETIKKWDEMCHTYNHCGKCPLGDRMPTGLITNGIQCKILRRKIANVLKEITDTLKVVEGAAAEWEKEQ